MKWISSLPLFYFIEDFKYFKFVERYLRNERSEPQNNDNDSSEQAKVKPLHKTESNLDIGLNIRGTHFWLSMIGSYTISQ